MSVCCMFMSVNMWLFVISVCLSGSVFVCCTNSQWKTQAYKQTVFIDMYLFIFDIYRFSYFLHLVLSHLYPSCSSVSYSTSIALSTSGSKSVSTSCFSLHNFLATTLSFKSIPVWYHYTKVTGESSCVNTGIHKHMHTNTHKQIQTYTQITTYRHAHTHKTKEHTQQ